MNFEIVNDTYDLSVLSLTVEIGKIVGYKEAEGLSLSEAHKILITEKAKEPKITDD